MSLPWFKALGISLALTELAECVTALCWKKRGTALVIVILANILTNPPVELISLVISRTNPNLFPAWVVFAETAAVITEAMVYRSRRDLFPHPWRFSLLLNAVSFAAGLLLQLFFGGGL